MPNTLFIYFIKANMNELEIEFMRMGGGWESKETPPAAPASKSINKHTVISAQEAFLSLASSSPGSHLSVARIHAHAHACRIQILATGKIGTSRDAPGGVNFYRLSTPAWSHNA